MLRSPAGFGKTTALADLAAGARAQGLLVGWISLDEDDTPNLFGSYLAAAFEHAGLDLTLLNAHDAWSSSPAVQQMGTLARAIELHAATCLLVLDEVDRLPRRTVQLVDLLVKRAPRNLHVAMAFRSDPGLELAPHVLNDGALVLGPGDLRFSKADITSFFQGGLSRRELAAVEKRTAGWPVAVTLYRNQRTHRGLGHDASADHLTDNYIGVCVLRDLSPEDRAHLLDLAVFDWLDADVVSDVHGTTASLARVTALPTLDGLLSPVGGDRAVRRLHPLVRDYCLDLLSADEGERVWRDNNLPSHVGELLDLDGQSWRTMEALSCARVRLLAALGDCAAAEELANRLYRVASERNLTRTALRCLALSMVVAHQAGQSHRAVARLVEFLRLTTTVDYVRPLVRHREVSRTVLRQLLGRDINDARREAAELMLVRLTEPSSATASVFSSRELQVLAGLYRGLRNKEIANELKITDDGVRYHLRNIYRKMGSSKRRDVARYAHSMGVSS